MDRVPKWLPVAERLFAIILWVATPVGILWVTTRPEWHPLNGSALYLPAITWIALILILMNIQKWTTSWVNRKNGGYPAFSLVDSSTARRTKGLYLRMCARPTEPLDRAKIVLAIRWICVSNVALSATVSAICVAGFFVLHQSWMFDTACGVMAVLGYAVYPAATGVLYRTGFFASDELVRELCLQNFSRALQEQTPIQAWHHHLFDLIRSPEDGSPAEFSAASWLFTYALLHRDLTAAAHWLARGLALLPEDAPFTEYIMLGDALHFYTVVVPDEGRSKSLTQRIRARAWELRQPQAYIEAALALAEGRRDEARSIAQQRLDRIGSEGGTAWIQLQRELLSRFRDL